MGELQKALTDLQSKRDKVYADGEAARAKVIATYAEVDKATASVIGARQARDEPALDAAMNALRVAKATYDSAVTAERPALIARVEADRQLRGARQALSDAARAYHAQADALANAVARIRADEVVPSASDRLSCEKESCAPISEIEHVAMLALGAWADTLDAGTLDPCPFSLLALSNKEMGLIRTLRAEATAAKAQAQAAETALLKAREGLAGALKPWDASIAQAVAEHQSPAANSHADELLGMAIDELAKTSSELEKFTKPYRAADETAGTARARLAAATARLEDHLTYWSDIARAVTNAATLADRGLGEPPLAGIDKAARVVLEGKSAVPPPPDVACFIAGAAFALSPACK
ncbi:MAG: hypothetical protein SFV19_19130 [Rhodospirillaceae bacterium]|nr:hypothetical protein [Rhodospirillaceae bacterium]